MNLAVVSLVIVGIAMVLMIIDIIPLGATLLLACIAMQLTGILEITRVYSDFGGTTVVFLVAMLIISNGIFEVGLAQDIGNKLFKTKIVDNERLLLVVVSLVAGLISAVASNSAVIAMFIPLIATAALESGGKIKQKNLLMAVGMTCAVGGAITLSGTTSQVVAQGLLEEAGVRTMTYFEMGKVGLPLLIITVVYMATIGYSLEKKFLTFEDQIDEELIPKEGEVFPTWKKAMVGIVTILVLIGFFTGLWNIAYVALVGATVLLATKTLDWKKSFRMVDWNTVVVLGAATAMAAGLNSSGGGQMIADWIMGIFGDASLGVVMGALAVLCLVLTNIMSNTATVAMLTPIAIGIAQSLNVEPITLVIPIAIASSCAVATPIGTPCMTQSMVAGYRFKDYLIVGLPLMVLLGIGLVVLCPIMYA